MVLTVSQRLIGLVVTAFAVSLLIRPWSNAERARDQGRRLYGLSPKETPPRFEFALIMVVGPIGLIAGVLLMLGVLGQ
jgi:hypothetical protein